MTGSIRLFTPLPIRQDTPLTLEPEQAHYLANVMRQSAGDFVCVFNGQDGEWRCRIDTLRKDRGIVVPERQTRPQMAEAPLTLVFAPLKRDTTNLVIEKATELGVTRLQPVFTERSNTLRLNLDRFAAIAREAAEQCERLSVPKICAPLPLYSLLEAWNPAEKLHAAIERSEANPPSHTTDGTALLVGPEGGFSPTELDVMRRTPFVERVGLGPRILRAETACIVGLALLQAAKWDNRGAAAAITRGPDV